jgi:hypothetical protein
LDQPIAGQIRKAMDIYLERQEQTPRSSIVQIAGEFALKMGAKSKRRGRDHWFAESITPRKARRA